MGELYNDLAKVYEAMYKTFMDYETEYQFYSEILEEYDKKNLLEIGSGTGNLAAYFIQNGFNYIGLDLSEDMIAIAKENVPDVEFIAADMSNFQLQKTVSSVIMVGRTISYLLTKQSINSTFANVHNSLETDGIFCFDFIDANQFIPSIAQGKEVVHEASFENVDYLRKSYWSLNLEHGMDFKWDSIYFKKVNEQLIEIGQDNSVIRTFTLREIGIFLIRHHFKIEKIIEKTSYAFPTYVIVARCLGMAKQ